MNRLTRSIGTANRMRIASLGKLPLIVLSTIITGCTDPNVGMIEGTISVDGEPAKMGSISFFFFFLESFTAGGAIEEGTYRAKVPVGEMRVEIRIPRAVGEVKLYDVPDSPTQPLLEEALPARFNDRSTLRITVVPGQSHHDFEVSTK